jgi:hypothetical protein
LRDRKTLTPPFPKNPRIILDSTIHNRGGFETGPYP